MRKTMPQKSVEIRYIKCLGYGRPVTRVYARHGTDEIGEPIIRTILKTADRIWLQTVHDQISHIEEFPKSELCLFPDGGLIVNYDWLFRRSRKLRNFVGLPLRSTETPLNGALPVSRIAMGPDCLYDIQELYERFYARFEPKQEIADKPFDGWYDVGTTEMKKNDDWGETKSGGTRSLF